MRKLFIAIVCAALLSMTACTSAVMADAETIRPVSVEEYTWGSFDTMRVKKVYQLALTDSARNIPTEDFERDGILYHMIEMTQEPMVGVDTKEYTESVTKDAKSGDTAEALRLLDAELPVVTPDGYGGTLILDHTSVKVAVKGYKTDTKNITAERTYPNLSDADLELIPKSITENGNALTLIDAQWSGDTNEDGDLRFTASAKYSGTATDRTATGYTVTANYTGNIVKTNCEMIAYTVIFSGTRLPDPTPTPVPSPTPTKAPEPEWNDTETENDSRFLSDRDRLSLAGCAGGVAALAAALLYGVKKIKRKRGKN